ncbi:unnamed protein product [Schistosoma curassoni]|uniref:FRAS1-related extracellular matrix protein 3 n=1 Tax=Schistosoma curassoni TaxID=6186 RepID=A0A183JWT3_9TREM|nr:unnamed protein product [Schistosoma curassoni]
MVVGGNRQKTMDPGSVLFGTRQQGVPVILRELMLPDRFNLVSPSFTLNLSFVLLGTHQQGEPVILRELVLPDGFNPVSPSFTVRDVTTELKETLEPGFVLLGTRQQGVPVILRELVLPDGFDPVSPSFTVREVNIGLTEHKTRVQDFLSTTYNHHLISIYSARSVESLRLVATLQLGR